MRIEAKARAGDKVGWLLASRYLSYVGAGSVEDTEQLWSANRVVAFAVSREAECLVGCSLYYAVGGGELNDRIYVFTVHGEGTGLERNEPVSVALS